MSEQLWIGIITACATVIVGLLTAKWTRTGERKKTELTESQQLFESQRLAFATFTEQLNARSDRQELEISRLNVRIEDLDSARQKDKVLLGISIDTNRKLWRWIEDGCEPPVPTLSEEIIEMMRGGRP